MNTIYPADRLDGTNKRDLRDQMSSKFVKLTKKMVFPLLMSSAAPFVAGARAHIADKGVMYVYKIISIDTFNNILHLVNVTTGEASVIDGDDRYGDFPIINEAKIGSLQYRRDQVSDELDALDDILGKIYAAEAL